MENWCRAVHAVSLMDYSVLFSLKGFAVRYPLGNSLQLFAFQDLGIKWHICHVSCFATRFLRRGLRRGLNSEEVVDGSEGSSSLLNQVL